MPQTAQNKNGILAANAYGYKYNSLFSTGNKPAANYNVLFKDDFSSGTLGNGYAGSTSQRRLPPQLIAPIQLRAALRQAQTEAL